MANPIVKYYINGENMTHNYAFVCDYVGAGQVWVLSMVVYDETTQDKHASNRSIMDANTVNISKLM